MKKFANSKNGRTTKPVKGGRNTRAQKFKDCDSNKVSPEYESSHVKPNDISWYSKNDVLLKSASNISYLATTGSRLDWVDATALDIAVNPYLSSVPGIMAINFVAGPGVCFNSTDPVNIAAQNIYTYIRNTNSGGKNYDAPDLMMYLLAMDSLYMAFNHCKRAYGIATTYSAVNKYLPTYLLQACGIEPQSMFSNMANVRTKLNILAAKLASFAVPTTMPYFLRHSWMASNVYLDADNAKASMYVFNPIGFHQFSETAHEEGGSLEWVDLGGYDEPITIDAALDKLDFAINRMLYSYDVGTISGDIMKAYGPSGLFTVSAVEDTYSVTPVYNEEVLLQIHNSTAHGIDTTSLAITQDVDTNNVVWQPTFPLEREGGFIKRPINMKTLEPTPADTMIATRLISCTAADSNNYVSCCTEIVRNYTIIQIQYNNSGVPNGVSTSFTTNEPISTSALTLLTQFDWHPILTPISVISSGASYAFELLYGDLNVFALANVEFLDNLNEVALLSLFNVPQGGKF